MTGWGSSRPALLPVSIASAGGGFKLERQDSMGVHGPTVKEGKAFWAACKEECVAQQYTGPQQLLLAGHLAERLTSVDKDLGRCGANERGRGLVLASACKGE